MLSRRRLLTPTTRADYAAVVLSMLGALALIWLFLAALSLIRSDRAFRLLPRTVPPAGAGQAARQLGLERLVYVDTDTPVAFCVGALQPRVVISRGAVTRLSGPGLLAVLAHEASHQSRREPLRRAMWTAAACAMLSLPLLRWWVAESIVRSELAADRAARRRRAARGRCTESARRRRGDAISCGLQRTPRTPAAQILGDQLPARHPGPAVLAPACFAW